MGGGGYLTQRDEYTYFEMGVEDFHPSQRLHKRGFEFLQRMLICDGHGAIFVLKVLKSSVMEVIVGALFRYLLLFTDLQQMMMIYHMKQRTLIMENMPW